MSSKEVVAAVMAADGDHEKKIALLKKAVVLVSKQKQNVEAQNAQLLDQLAAVGVELSSTQEEKQALEKRLLALEAELAQYHSRGNGFGQHVLKGLSSLMSGAEDGIVGGVGQRPGGKDSRQASLGTGLSLSAEDIERLIADNENLHRQVYELKSKSESDKRRNKGTKEKLVAERAKLQYEVDELRSVVDTTTKACDHLNAECARQRAMVAFCQQYFSLSVDTKAVSNQALRVVTANRQDEPPPPEAIQEMIAQGVKSTVTLVTALLSGVSVLIIALRDALPSAARATVIDLRCITHRLSTALDAHTALKDQMMHHLQQLTEQLSGTEGSSAASTSAMVQTVEGDLLSDLSSWLRLMALHAPLLVQSCVCSLAPDHTFRLTRVDASGNRTASVVDRAVFVTEMAKQCSSMLYALQGSVEATQELVRCRSRELSVERTPTTGEWLLALQCFWWEGCSQQAAIQHAAMNLVLSFTDITEACACGYIRDALVYIKRAVQQLVPPVGVDWGSVRMAGDADRLEKTATAHPHAGAQDCDPRVVNYNEEELLHALAAADCSAVCYYTQMNDMFLELADAQDRLHAAEEDTRELRRRLAEQAVEGEDTRRALQEQIALLSDQLADRAEV